jgi:hypothetical protein
VWFRSVYQHFLNFIRIKYQKREGLSDVVRSLRRIVLDPYRFVEFEKANHLGGDPCDWLG